MFGDELDQAVHTETKQAEGPVDQSLLGQPPGRGPGPAGPRITQTPRRRNAGCLLAAFFVLMLISCLLYVPTVSIVNSIAFAHLKNPQRDFGLIRVGGNIGWVLAAWPLTFILVDWAKVHEANPSVEQGVGIPANPLAVLRPPTVSRAAWPDDNRPCPSCGRCAYFYAGSWRTSWNFECVVRRA